MEKFYLEADIKLEEETEDLKKAVAAVINLPSKNEKQPDLLYFSAIFVSAGTNLNNAHFLPSELVKAENTIVSKALDVEHKEEEIIGHIYDRAFINADGEKLDLSALAGKEAASLDRENMDIHVVIAGVVYKSRFPNMAEEISNKKWKVSMECYFGGYDVKVGDVIMTRREAESMGLTEDDSIFGKLAKVLKKGKEIAEGKLERVLRNIVFSGCGVVKNPANAPSVILETANKKDTNVDSKETITLDYDKLEQEEDDNKLTSDKVEGDNSVITEPSEEDAELHYNDTVGICVNYKRKLFAQEPVGPDTKVLHEDWCTLYEQACTSFSRDTTDPDCLRYKLGKVVHTIAKKLIKIKEESDKRDELVDVLEKVIDKAKKLN